MTEKPIIFNDTEVRAILEGRKTQTRRIVRPQPTGDVWCDGGGWLSSGHGEIGDTGLYCPYGDRGDLLWVRETWAPGWTYGGDYPCVLYRATGDGYIGSEQYPVRDVISGRFGIHSGRADASVPDKMRWRSSTHMPRWASRITLEITDVRVERLRQITGSDAVAEGVRSRPPDCGVAQNEFHDLWDAINAKRGHGWETNPWVWVIEFKRVENKS